MKGRKRISCLVLLIMLFIFEEIVTYAAFEDTDYENVGKAFTIQTYPYLYKESQKLMAAYEKIDEASLVGLREESKIFSSKKYFVKTVNVFDVKYYYYGKLKDEKPEGKGVLLIKTDDNYIPCYIGEFSKGYFSGFGIEYRIDDPIENGYLFYQVIYEGEYKEGERTGKGCEYYTAVKGFDSILERSVDVGISGDDTSGYADEFVKNAEKMSVLLQGTVSIYEKNIQCGKYYSQYPLVYISKHMEGDWKNGKLDGTATVYDVGNYLYAEGKFKDDIPNGKVTVYYPYSDRVAFKGNMKKGEPDGKGTLYFKSGKMEYEGNFKNGKYSGKGTLYDENGNVIHKGKFKNGDVS